MVAHFGIYSCYGTQEEELGKARKNDDEMKKRQY